jgi:hypothetical protein
MKSLIELYSDAAAKIDSIIVMRGNWCFGFEPYPGPGVMAPIDKTNIVCDPAAENYNLDGNDIKFNHI